MNFDKFKNVLPQKIQLKSDDTEYLQHLNGLKEPKSSNALRIVGTVAAAVVIVLLVSLWALIGRGVRGAGEPIVSPPATEGVRVQITDEMQSAFNEMSHKLRLFALPIFERGENPAQKAFSDYVYYLTTPAKSDWIITATELNDLYFDTFGVKSAFTEGITYSGPYSVNVSMTGIALLSFTRGALQDGTPIITLTYGEPDVSVTTLTYVPITDFEPDYFIEHTTKNTVIIKETNSHFVSETVYKVSGDGADTLLDIVKVGKKTKDSDVCYCCPDYRIVFNDIEYSVVMGGDKNMAHIVYTDGLGETFNYRLTDSEYALLEKTLAKCAVESNFVEKKHYEPQYSPKETEVKIVVDEGCEQYDAGTYVIPGDDAKTFMRMLDSKRYVYNKAQLDTGISIHVGDRYYSLSVGDEPFIQNECGRCPIEKNDPVIERIDRYVTNGIVIQTVHPTYDESEFISKEQAVRIAVDEAKKDKYDYQGWDSDFYFDESGENVPILTSDKTYGNGFWVKEWYNEKCSDMETVCWVVRLYDKNDPLTSLVLYIDGILGEVVGGATISD